LVLAAQDLPATTEDRRAPTRLSLVQSSQWAVAVEVPPTLRPMMLVRTAFRVARAVAEVRPVQQLPDLAAREQPDKETLAELAWPARQPLPHKQVVAAAALALRGPACLERQLVTTMEGTAAMVLRQLLPARL